jgi:hypothetical protein
LPIATQRQGKGDDRLPAQFDGKRVHSDLGKMDARQESRGRHAPKRVRVMVRRKRSILGEFHDRAKRQRDDGKIIGDLLCHDIAADGPL